MEWLRFIELLNSVMLSQISKNKKDEILDTLFTFGSVVVDDKTGICGWSVADLKNRLKSRGITPPIYECNESQ